MTRQWKLYTNYREVMDDYGEVFMSDRDGSSEVYEGAHLLSISESTARGRRSSTS